MQMFRRALKEAVMDGKEWVGWTTGETQAARYDLSKQIDSIRSYKNPDGLYSVQLIKDGVVIDAKSQLKEAGLSEMVGKELADKIVSGEGKNIETETSRKLNRQDREFSGLDLKVGGEGMKAFYDKILPNEVAKYVKQWGGTVEKSSVPIRTASRAEPDIFGDYTVPKGPKRTETAEIWKVRVTPEMVEGLKQLDEIEMVS